MHLSEDSSVIINFPKTLVRTAVQAFWITLLSSQKPTEIVVIFTKSFSLSLSHENLMFEWTSTCSGVELAS